MSTEARRKELSVYEKICAEKCEWCAKGFRRLRDHELSPLEPVFVHAEDDAGGKRIPCSAATPIAVIADLAWDVGELRKSISLLVDWFDLEAVYGENHDVQVGEIREYVDNLRAALAAEKVG